MEYGFVKVASAIPGVRPGNCEYNAERIIGLMQKAEAENANVICFPELCITGYTCQDLFESSVLLEDALKALNFICETTKDLRITGIVGVPLVIGGVLMNCAVVVQGGTIVGVIPKTYLPNYKEFYEHRWFSPAASVKAETATLCGIEVPVGANLLFKTPYMVFGIEICEDLWAPVPPSSRLALAGAEIVFNLSADDECVGKNSYLKSMIMEQSARNLAGYIFSSCGFGESTQDLVFAGNSIICENGKILAQNKRFSLDEQLIFAEIDLELLRHERRVNTTFSSCATMEIQAGAFRTVNIAVNPTKTAASKLSRKIPHHPFIPASDLDERCNEIISIQAEGLAKRLMHTNAQTVVVGVSGGLDSTLALLVCAKAFEMLHISLQRIIGITMPGFGTSKETHTNALALMEELGITIREISINAACLQHFNDIGHDPAIHDITYENSQARERTQILMDVANQTNGLVIGTGDLSELALGWATYNGDHMSMYGVNCSIPKTLIIHLINWIAVNSQNAKVRSILIDIINTPISPELIPTDENGEITQKTEDKIGPYELHDFFLYYALRYGFGPEKIYFLARNAFGGNDAETEGVPQYDDATIKHWLKIFFRRFFAQQFKRSCLPDGPKVGSCSLSPRGDWRMPSDADAKAWLKRCEEL